MQTKQRIKILTDILMTILSVFLMGGTILFPNDRVHQILGMALCALWILHVVLNNRWFSSIFKGKHSPYRIMQIFVNLGVGLSALCLMISGLMMAWFLPVPNGLGIARVMHLVSSHWYYIFMCFHLGLHLGIIIFKLKPATNRINHKMKIFLSIILALICAYGIYAFILRGIWKYVFLSQEFFFFDLERGFIFFVLDYISILILIATVSYYLGKFLQQMSKKR